MPTVLRLSMLVLGALSHAVSLACGVCIEDKVAATYDYGVVMTATARGHVVVFGQMEGTADMQQAALKIAATAGRIRGVNGRTVRTSAAPASFSFELDAAAQPPEAAVAQLQKRLHAGNVHLSVVRVVTRESMVTGRPSKNSN